MSNPPNNISHKSDGYSDSNNMTVDHKSEQSSSENSYTSILKRISAFGGVQIFNILLNLIRGKFVAILLGPGGMGISSLYSGVSSSVQQFASLGLNLAIVKEIAASKNSPIRVRYVRHTVKILIFFTAICGLMACFIPAGLWSDITFGSYMYKWGFVGLGVAVAFTILGNGLMAILQGLGYIKLLTKASLIGGIVGLVVGVPLYYFFSTDGIVPAMVLLAFSIFLFYWISLRKIDHNNSADWMNFSFKRMRPLIFRLVSLGVILMIGNLVGTLVNYLINLYIRSSGSLDDVGLFQAASSLTNQYVGLIFSALALDYFPRLSTVASNPTEMRRVVNRQTEIVMLVSTPLLILLILSTPLIIKLLLSDSFLSIIPLMRWLGLGMAIQVIAFPIGYIYVAKNDRKAYIWMEVIWANICWLVCSIYFYHQMGLIGLGVSLVVRGSIDLIINLWVCMTRYGFTYSLPALWAIGIGIILMVIAFLASFFINIMGWIIMGSCLIISAYYSWIRLRKGIKSDTGQ